MGANCCVARRRKGPAHRTGAQFSTHRNVRCSPSWSFRRDNRTHVEDISGNHARFSSCYNRNVGSEIKSSMDTETEGLSDGGSAPGSSETPKWHKSPLYGGSAEVPKGIEEDSYIKNDSSSEEMEPNNESLQIPKISNSMVSRSSTFRGEPSTSRSHSLPTDPTSSRNAWRSPHYQLSRQISDSCIPIFKSLKENNANEGSQSVGFSVCSNDLRADRSHGGSSDGWSVRMFSELVASSQRESWSFDSESTTFSFGRISRSNSPLVSPSPADLHTCRICSKLVKERASWSSKTLVSNSELSVVAVLVCGHVYHDECLESMITDADRYDPSCPVCVGGEKSTPKATGKGKAIVKGRNKISRNAVADVDLDGISIQEKGNAEWEAKVPRLGSSSSLKSFGRPFLRRPFSVGSRPTQPIPKDEQTRKKGFWGRYHTA